jgi:hypothetical protein
MISIPALLEAVPYLCLAEAPFSCKQPTCLSIGSQNPEQSSLEPVEHRLDPGTMFPLAAGWVKSLNHSIEQNDVTDT